MKKLAFKYFATSLFKSPIGVLALCVYGVFVCPFIESLTHIQSLTIFVSSFGLALIPYLIFQFLFIKQLQKPVYFFDNISGFIFICIELALWVLCGFLVACLNTWIHDFPFLMSGGKVLIASLTIGLLSGTLNMLKFQEILITNLKLRNKKPNLPNVSFISMSQKVLLSFVFVATTSVLSINLLVFKNINILHFRNVELAQINMQQAQPKPMMAKKQMMAKKLAMQKKAMMDKNASMEKAAMMKKKAMMAKNQMVKKEMPADRLPASTTPTAAKAEQTTESTNIFKKLGFFTDTSIITAIMKEVAYCLIVIFGFLFFITRQFIINLKQIFKMQSKLFDNFRDNNFSKFMPIIQHDEFGLISNEVNEVVLQLKDKQRIKSIFGKFISPSIAEELLSSDSEVKLGGVKKEACILFCDIRNYTELSENLEPKVMVKLLNEYFTVMVAIIHKHGGILDKFIGDAFMAFFDSEDSSQCATQASIEIQDALNDIKLQWQEHGVNNFSIGIGLNYGEVIMGNIGSKERLEYTVIGDAVNVAARLESETKLAHSPILISKSIYDQLPLDQMVHFEHYDSKNLKGKSNAIEIYKFVKKENLEVLKAA